jgi:multisubunit Na+/H+ antiporter MnhG subunit
MTAAEILICVLLAVTALSVLLSALALLLVRNLYEQLHFSGAAVILGGGALCAAIFVHNGWSAGSLKALLLLFILFWGNAVLAHATARAARIRQLGRFDPDPARSPQYHSPEPEKDGQQ